MLDAFLTAAFDAAVIATVFFAGSFFGVLGAVWGWCALFARGGKWG